MVGARITSLAHVVPPGVSQQGLWDGYFAAQYDNDERAARIWRSAGIEHRHGVVDPTQVDLADWTTAQRMQRFLVEAVPLGKEASSAALAGAGVPATDIGLFAVASCTGYVTPGLDIILARDLAMDPSVQRLGIGHMGCYAALPGLGTISDFARSRGRSAMLLCAELPSLHVQRTAGRLTSAGIEQLVAHALFADAAAAVVVAPDGPGWEVVDIEARTDSDSSDYMTWEVTDTGFRMGLSPRVPDVLARHVGPVIGGMLARHGLRPDSVTGWAVHPGGPRILDVVADRLGLPAEALSASEDVLRDYGNCSSATVLLVLERLLGTRTFSAGDTVVMLAFGPGLTLYATLLRYTD